MYYLLCLALASLASAQLFQSVSVMAPGRRVHEMQLHAADKAFHTGLSGPFTSCPFSNILQCPMILGTLVLPTMTGMASLVPGGQTIYVQTDGQVRFSAARINLFPPGALENTFVDVPESYNGEQVVEFNDGEGHTGLAICFNDTSPTIGTLFAKTASFDMGLGNCTEIDGLTLKSAGNVAGAWQYE
ncbi:hypothetical protein F4808DRAFT_26338 [Astrocystis sublimbata]|nr:hypothetical protein F4808DRAFT_26338 [Astrocystis sublimbata]